MNFSQNIALIEEKIGYVFKDKSLITQAFTRTSFCNEHRQDGRCLYQSNEVLEFFGDSVLSAAIVTLLVKDFSTRYEHGIKTRLNEGDFSNIKSKLSDKKNLSERMRELGLHKLLRMGEGDSKLGIENEPSVMEDLFESIIGAIYIDSGMNMNAVIVSVSKMLDVRTYLTEKTQPIQSFKNSLQEWCADKKRRLPPPIYKTVSESGPEHKKTYERACYIGDKLYGTGVGKNQKLADSAAAEAALKMLQREERKNTAKHPDEKAQILLKEYARSHKKASPIFKDMGETDRSEPELPEYAVSCIFSGFEAVGTGADKREARSAAAERILCMIKKKKETATKKSSAPTEIKHTKKNTTAKKKGLSLRKNKMS